MFRKDSGAHFTYNLGVGILRWSVMFLLWALLIAAEWFFLSSPKFVYEATVEVGSVKTVRAGDDIYTATFEILSKDETVYTHTQYITGGVRKKLGEHNFLGDTYHIYRLKGRGIRAGEEYGEYISRNSELVAEWQYFFATPGARPPVHTWGIWVSLGISVLLFIIGRRQIKLSMKYPRSDVPFGSSGLPENTPDGELFRDMAEQAAAARTMLLADSGTEEDSEDDKETFP